MLSDPPDGLFAQRVGPTGPDADAGVGRRLVLAHGFTQNGRCWGEFGQRLADVCEVTFVDAPGHGRSANDDADLWRSAELLGDAGGSAIYVGYSMGGRTALHTALTRPDLVRGLVLIGATAGLDHEDERAARRDADAALADRLLADGLPACLERWLASPLFAGLGEEQAALEQRLTNRAEGLAESLRRCGTGTQDPLWDRLGELTMPVLIVIGDRDHKFSALGQRLLAGLTASEAQILSIPGTHAVHLERPAETAAAILSSTADW